MRLAALASLVLLVAACDRSDDDAIRVDLQVGQELRYTTRFVSDGLLYTDGPVDVSGRLVERVVSSRQRLGDLRGLTVVELEQVEDDRPDVTYNTRTWYRPSDERLEEIAYEFYGDGYAGMGSLRTAAVGDPALPRLVRLAMARQRAARSGGDSTGGTLNAGPQVRETPRIVLEYPAETGRTWTHFVLDGDLPSRDFSREVVGTETITTPAGTFRCVVVRSRSPFYPTDDAFVWLDWIADVGLVRRTLVSRDPVTVADGSVVESVTTESVELVAVED